MASDDDTLVGLVGNAVQVIAVGAGRSTQLANDREERVVDLEVGSDVIVTVNEDVAPVVIADGIALIGGKAGRVLVWDLARRVAASGSWRGLAVDTEGLLDLGAAVMEDNETEAPDAQ